MISIRRKAGADNRQARSSYLLAFIYCLIIFASIAALGAARPFALSSVCTAMALLCMLALTIHGIGVELRFWVIATGFLLFATIALGVAQAGLGTLLDYLGVVYAPRSLPFSNQKADTIFSIQIFAFPAITFLTGLLILQEHNTSRAVNLMLTVGTVAIILASLIQFWLAPSFIFIWEKQAYKDSFTATFINRNSAGTFIGLVILLLVRQFWSSCRYLRSREILAAFFLFKKPTNRSVGRIYILSALIVISCIALFLTKSRGATISTFISVITLSLILFWLREHRRFGGILLAQRVALAFVGLLLLVAVSVIVMGERVSQRVEMMGNDDPRFCVLPGITQALKDNFWLGSGMGTFESTFAAYRDPECGLLYVWEKAHNTYLQSWIEIGIAAPVIATLLVCTFLSIFIYYLFNVQRERSYVALGFASILLVTTHAAVDFSIELPGVSGLVAAITAIALTVSKRKLSVRMTPNARYRGLTP